MDKLLNFCKLFFSQYTNQLINLPFQLWSTVFFLHWEVMKLPGGQQGRTTNFYSSKVNPAMGKDARNGRKEIPLRENELERKPGNKKRKRQGNF